MAPIVFFERTVARSAIVRSSFGMTPARPFESSETPLTRVGPGDSPFKPSSRRIVVTASVFQHL